MGQRPEITLVSQKITLALARDLALFPNEKNIEVPLDSQVAPAEPELGLLPKIWLPIPKGIQRKN